MKIELKFNINDVVWFMFNNKCTFAKIANWVIDGHNGFPIITYFLFNSETDKGINENLLFNTKINLLNSL